MVTLPDLLERVADAFVETGEGIAPWPDPHPFWTSPSEDEYSRCSDPQKWRIVVARTEAWIAALTQLGLATVERDVEWPAVSSANLSRVDVVRSVVEGTLAAAVGQVRVDGIDDAGVLIGIFEPAIELAVLPSCGCDACDPGSSRVLEEIDSWFADLVTGTTRHLSRRPRTITVRRNGLNGTGTFRRIRSMEAIVANPTGWHEVSGASWLG